MNFVNQLAVVIEGVELKDCVSTQLGGGILFQTVNNATVKDSVIRNCSSSGGGGIRAG